MSLNIKNSETHRLVRELARQMGASQTTAVTQAVIEKLESLKRSKQGEVEKLIMEISRDSAARFKEPFKSMSIDEFLYGPDGLPR